MDKDQLQDYQKQVLMDIESGWTQTQMSVIASGRGVGKSMLTQQWMKKWLDSINEPRPITEIILAEGRVYGNRYYTAAPAGGNWKEMEAWCVQTYGAHGGAIWGADPKKAPVPNERWYMNNSKFWFRNLKDRDWFIMRWSAT